MTGLFPKISGNLTRLFLLLLVLTITGTWLVKEQTRFQRDGYILASSLDADLVYNCQKAARKYGLHWAVLASYYSVTKQQPTAAEIFNQAAEIASTGQSEQKYFSAVLTGEELSLLKQQAQQIKRFGYYFSPQYVFPTLKKGVYFADTWLADRDGGRRKHLGTDIFGRNLTPIYAVSGGRIEKLGWNRLGGKRIGIRDIHGNYIYYAHLAAYGQGLREGSRISPGQLIGYMGHTGNAEDTPDHLHLGIMTPRGQWVNPYHFVVYWYKYGQNPAGI